MSDIIYNGKRNFLGKKDLVIAFYTQACQFACSFCDLPSRSAKDAVSAESVNKQIDWVFEQYVGELGTFRQLSAGNEGSILDSVRFPRQSLDHLLTSAVVKMGRLEIVSLETRPEYITEETVEYIRTRIGDNALDFTIGFETQDDYLRNEVLRKHMSRGKFEQKLRLMGQHNIRLTSYVLLKPGPEMSEDQGVEEALATIRYLKAQADASGVDLVVYLNPMYAAANSPLAEEMKRAGYQPPGLDSVARTILESRQLAVPIYVGLWSEGLATVDFTRRKDYNPDLKNALKKFNRTQNYRLLEGEM